MARLLDPAILGVMIPIVAIVTGGVVALSAIWIRHRERMAMIEAGMHPDHPDPEGALDEGDHDEVEALSAGDEVGVLEADDERRMLEGRRSRFRGPVPSPDR